MNNSPDWKKRRKWEKICNITLLVLLVFLIAAVIFTYFRVITDARMTLREGKNVKLALDMLEIQLYPEKKTVYDESRQNNLAKGIEESVYRIIEQKGTIQDVSYSKTKRKITGLVYEKDAYRVVYLYDEENGDQWKVDYFINLLDYSY